MVSNTEQNLRLNPIDGTLNGTDPALNPAGNVVAAAYSNNVVGARATTLYDIDWRRHTAIQNPPNDGTLTRSAPGARHQPERGHRLRHRGRERHRLRHDHDRGISRLYIVNLTTGAATLQSSIGSGSTAYLGVTATPKTVAFDSASVAADEGGAVTLTVSRRGPTKGALTVEYATSSGSASSGQDFEPASGTLSSANGESTSKPIAVAIKDDAEPEGTETFDVTLSNPSAGTTVTPPAAATVTIGASDQPPPLVDLDKPVLSTSAKTPQRLGRVLKRGVAFKMTTSEACLLTADLRLAKRLAKRLRLPRRIARKRAALAAGSRALRVRPTRRAARKLRPLRRVRVTLAASCVDVAGNRGVAKGRKLTLRR